ncbi:hypothetical protein GCM10010300_76020 [Streptomyces olivaceoviridis]|nr:hypothetical protein GCM10010300_76020 [Streptomyces olivaceoviridis]
MPGPKRAKVPGRNSRVVARWGESTPLGRPVVPEVKKTQAGSCPDTFAGTKPGALPAADARPPGGGVHSATGGPSAPGGASAATRTLASNCVSTSATQPAGHLSSISA